jgi:hypothetical protein
MQSKEYLKYYDKVFLFLTSQLFEKIIAVSYDFINEKNTKFYTISIEFITESNRKKEIVFKKVKKNFADEYIYDIVRDALDSFDNFKT